MIEDKKEVSIQCGECELVVGKDKKDRPTLTPFCPSDEKGNPKLSREVKALWELLQSEEVVLKSPKIKLEE